MVSRFLHLTGLWILLSSLATWTCFPCPSAGQVVAGPSSTPVTLDQLFQERGVESDAPKANLPLVDRTSSDNGGAGAGEVSDERRLFAKVSEQRRRVLDAGQTTAPVLWGAAAGIAVSEPSSIRELAPEVENPDREKSQHLAVGADHDLVEPLPSSTMPQRKSPRVLRARLEGRQNSKKVSQEKMPADVKLFREVVGATSLDFAELYQHLTRPLLAGSGSVGEKSIPPLFVVKKIGPREEGLVPRNSVAVRAESQDKAVVESEEVGSVSIETEAPPTDATVTLSVFEAFSEYRKRVADFRVVPSALGMAWVEAPGYLGRRLDPSKGGVGRGGSSRIELIPEAFAKQIRWALLGHTADEPTSSTSTPGFVFGQLVGHRGEVVGGLRIFVRPVAGGDEREAEYLGPGMKKEAATSRRGHFVFSQIPAGSYVLSVRRGSETVTSRYFHLESGEGLVRTWALGSDVVVSGRVAVERENTDPESSVLTPGLSVRLDGSSREVSIQEGGRFSLAARMDCDDPVHLVFSGPGFVTTRVMATCSQDMRPVVFTTGWLERVVRTVAVTTLRESSVVVVDSGPQSSGLKLTGRSLERAQSSEPEMVDFYFEPDGALNPEQDRFTHSGRGLLMTNYSGFFRMLGEADASHHSSLGMDAWVFPGTVLYQRHP